MYHQEKYEYRDMNQGNFKSFQGKEDIRVESSMIYKLKYFSGVSDKKMKLGITDTFEDGLLIFLCSISDQKKIIVITCNR